MCSTTLEERTVEIVNNNMLDGRIISTPLIDEYLWKKDIDTDLLFSLHQYIGETY